MALQMQGLLSVKPTLLVKGLSVRLWPIADMGSCTAHVRFRGVKRT